MAFCNGKIAALKSKLTTFVFIIVTVVQLGLLEVRFNFTVQVSANGIVSSRASCMLVAVLLSTPSIR